MATIVNKSTPGPSIQAQQTTAPLHSAPMHDERPLSDIIGQPFTPFDHQTAVVRPFADESARDAAFAQGMCVYISS